MLRWLLMGCCGVVWLSQLASAQEFRVYSRLETDGEERAAVVSRSLTLWHAGKVYDLIHAAGEVTILEPAHRRCWILNSSKKLATSVDFDELRSLLNGAEDRLLTRIQELDGRPNVSSDVGDSLRFQLRPRFESRFDTNEQRLLLKSKFLSYEVSGQTSVPRESLEAYLNYADWMCRLNFVLHPQPVFPTARLELNNELRRIGLMPREVRLHSQSGESLHLKASHVLTWNLDAQDRASIHHWESLLRDPKLRQISLTEYRRALVGTKIAKSGD